MSNTATKVLAFVKVSNELNQRYQHDLEIKQAQAAVIQAKIPAVVDALIANDRIAETQKQAVAEALTDPAVALDLLRDLAAHRNTAELASIGTPTGDATGVAKQASSRRAVDDRVSDFDDLPSGQAFRAALAGMHR